jgi:hypothetical protein
MSLNHSSSLFANNKNKNPWHLFKGFGMSEHFSRMSNNIELCALQFHPNFVATIERASCYIFQAKKRTKEKKIETFYN